MEFCADIALLQSALQLADQKTVLKNYTKKCESDTMNMVTQVIKEICDGIDTALSADRSSLNKLKITTLLVSKVFSAAAKLDETVSESANRSWLDDWEHLLYGLPELSWHFVFDSIKASNNWPQVFKLLPHLPPTASSQLLSELLLYLTPPSDVSDSEILIHTMAYVSLHWSSPIYLGNQSDGTSNGTLDDTLHFTTAMSEKNACQLTENLIWQSFSDNNQTLQNTQHLQALFLNLLKAIDEIRWELVKHVDLLLGELSLCNIFGNLFRGYGWALCPIVVQKLAVKQNQSSVHQRPLSVLVNVLHNGDKIEDELIGILISEIQEDALPVSVVKVAVGMNDDHIALDTAFEHALTKLRSRKMDPYLQKIENYDPGVFLHDKNEKVYKCLWSKIHQFILVKQHESLQNLLENSDRDKVKILFVNYLNPVMEYIQNIERQMREEGEKLLTRLGKAVAMIDYHVDGAQEQLRWMLQTKDIEVIQHPSWIECLENQQKSISEDTDQGYLVLGVTQLAWLKSQPPVYDHITPRLQKLLSRSFSESGLDHQDTVLDALSKSFTNSQLEALFDVDSSLDHQLRAALNRLTVDNLDKSMPALSRICVQSPMRVVRGILQAAAHNRGQITVLVQVIRKIPSILKFGSETSDGLLTALRDMIHKGETLDNKHTKNIASLCRHLLLPNSIGENPQPPVLSHMQLLHSLVLPNILPAEKPEQPMLNRPLILKLLLVAIDTMNELDSDWSVIILSTNPVLLLRIILFKVDSGTANNDLDLQREHDKSVEVVDCNERADWLECLVPLIQTLEKHHELVSEEEINWLRGQVESCYWATQWYCYKLFTLVLGEEKFKLKLPCSLLELVHLPAAPLPLHEDGVLSLLQFVRLSEVTLTLAKSGLGTRSEFKLSQIVLGLSVLLRYCTGTELSRMLRLIQHWLSDGQANSSIIANISTGVQSFQLLDLAVQLLMKSAGHTQLGHSWTNIATTIAFTVKVTILSSFTEPNVLCPCFIVLCNMLSYWPDTEAAHHLLTLGLDIISQLDSMLQNGKPDSKSETIVEDSEIYGQTMKTKSRIMNFLLNRCRNIDIELQEPLMKAVSSLIL